MAQTNVSRYHLASCPANTGREESCTCDREVAHYLHLAKWSFGLFVLEVIGGWLSGSIALLSDAVHILLDFVENIVGAIVSRLARKRDDEMRLRRIGGSISAALLLIAAIVIVQEGYERLMVPHEVEWYMAAFAATGLLVNWHLKRRHDAVPGEHRNLTHFWQDWHLLSDIASQAAVLVGGIVMTAMQGWYWIDGALSIAIGMLIMVLVAARLLGFEFHRHHH